MSKMKSLKSYQNGIAAALVLWLLSLACSSLVPPSNVRDVPASAPSGSIVYSSDESGNFEIYHMNIKSLAKTRLTDNTSEEVTPFYFLPAHFGFVSDKSGNYQIYRMDLDGSNQEVWKKDDKRLLFTPGISSDGEKIAYIVQNNSKNSDLYVSKSDGTEEKRLTRSSGMKWDPSWSLDGKEIVFSSDSDGDFEIDIINLEGGKTKKLTDNTFYDGRPRWSPDGNRILFESDRDGDWEIYVMDADGGNVTAITENSSVDWGASWSPYGKWIVYISSFDGDDEIYIVGIDGTHQLKLTNNTAQDRFPAWVP